jgi:hypothetical protein
MSIRCLPDYQFLKGVANSENAEMIDNIELGEFHMNYYTPAAILQEFNRSLYCQKGQDKSVYSLNESDFCIKSKLISSVEAGLDSSVWQDPARRLVFARDRDRLEAISTSVTSIIRQGILQASLFVITLGLVEQFYCRNEANIIFFNQHPTYLGLQADKSVLSQLFVEFMSFAQITKTLNSLISAIRSVSQAPVVFTVSPVPLERTFRRNMNVFEANLLSKSLLLSATREFIETVHAQNVFFFPSYELASGFGSAFFQDRDLRHPRNEFVELITKLFIDSLAR